MRDAEHKGRARKCKNLIGFSDFNFLPKTNNCFWHIQYRLNLRSWRRWAVCWQCIFREPGSVWFLCMGSVVNTAGIKSSNLKSCKDLSCHLLNPSYNTTLLSNIPRKAIQSLPKHLQWWGIYWLAYQKPLLYLDSPERVLIIFSCTETWLNASFVLAPTPRTV